MNPKLAEFGSDGTPQVMWAYLWTIEPAHGCYLPDGRFLPAGYYPYRIGPDPARGWQLALGDGPGLGKAEVNQTRGQAMKKVWGQEHQTEFIYSCWDLPPSDLPPSSIFVVDTSTATPRVGAPLLQCYGTPDGNKVLVCAGAANSNRLRPLLSIANCATGPCVLRVFRPSQFAFPSRLGRRVNSQLLPNTRRAQGSDTKLIENCSAVL
jgi:hypothetical protein